MAESKRERPMADDEDENPAPTKRADPDDLNEEQQDTLLNNPNMLAFFAAWNRMNWDEKRLAYEGIMEHAPQNKPFMGLVPPDIQKMIAYSTAGTLMKLARVNKFFYALASDDNVWKRMFARDYPEDFAFCRGELPFFILTRDHPLYLPGSIPEFENMPWKRFYLQTEFEYRMVCNHMLDDLQMDDPDDVNFMDFQTAGARDIYKWFVKVCVKLDGNITSGGKEVLSRTSSLVWLFICAFVALTQTTQIDSRFDCVDEFWRFAEERNWMHLYFHTMSENFSTNESDDLVFPQGPHPQEWLEQHYPGNEGFRRHRASAYMVFVEKRLSQDDLFSINDRKNLESLLTAAVNSNVMFPSFETLNYEERVARTQGFLKFWDLLAACLKHPCVLNIRLATYRSDFALQMAHLAHNSLEVKTNVSQLMAILNPGTVLLPFPRAYNDDRWGEPILSNPMDQRRLDNILYPWTEGNWGGEIPFLPEHVTLRRSSNLAFFFKSNLVLRYQVVKRKEITVKGEKRKVLSYMERPMCIACGAIPILPKQCGGVCGDAKAIYCNADCQRAHWHKGHAQVCGKK